MLRWHPSMAGAAIASSSIADTSQCSVDDLAIILPKPSSHASPKTT